MEGQPLRLQGIREGLVIIFLSICHSIGSIGYTSITGIMSVGSVLARYQAIFSDFVISDRGMQFLFFT